MLIVSVENVQYYCIFFHQVCWILTDYVIFINDQKFKCHTEKKLSKMKNMAAWTYGKKK